MKTAYVYVRVGTIDKVGDLSLKNQKRVCLEYAKSKGYLVKGVFIDKGESAVNCNRAGLQRLFKAIDKDFPTTVICTSIDRMFRNIVDFSKTRNQFKKKGIRLVAINSGGDITSGVFGEILVSIAQYESEVAS